MPIILTMLGGVLLSLVENMVARVITALAIGYIGFQGIDLLMGYIKSRIIFNLEGLPADALAILSIAKVGIGINIIMTAIMIKISLKGIQAGGTFMKSYTKGK